MQTELYIVDFPRRSDYAEAAVIQNTYNYDRIARCPECGSPVSGAYWTRPREAVLTNRKAPDFLYIFTDNVPFLLSHNALEKFCQAGLTGIINAEEIETVRFQRKSKTETGIPRYYHVELARSRITIHHEKSVIHYGDTRHGSYCPLCNQAEKTLNFTRHLEFHTECYEGYDIFQIYEMGNTTFLSQRFVDFCQENSLTNLHYTPAQKHDSWAASYFLDGDENA